VVNFSPSRLILEDTNPGIQLNRRLDRSQSGSELGRREKFLVLPANRTTNLVACSLIIIRNFGFQKISEGLTRKFMFHR